LGSSALAWALVATLTAQSLAQPAPPPPPAPPKAAPTAPPAAPPKAPAAPPAGAPGADAPPPVPDESKKAEAKAHFEKGLTLLNDEAWSAALAEFLISRELYPTRAATKNAGTALRKLQRYDESLDMYETLLREFPNMPPEARAEAQQAVAEMRDLVGTIDIRGAEPGAAIIISGQARGEWPPVTPLRVSAGAHVVRLLKDGFEPFEAKVDVAGGQTSAVQAKLRPVVASGRLRVVERSDRPLEVVIDGAPKGNAPWEGVLPVGNHAIVLRGKGRLGTAPALATVKLQQLSTVTLTAEELDANLRVVPTPASGVVAIDGVPVGGGGEWYGPLKSGTHKVTVAMDGYLPETREIKLAKGDVQRIAVKLEVDPKSPMWRKPSHWVIDTDVGFVAVLPSLGGVAAGCGGSCSKSVGMGALGAFHTGYELGNGVGFGISLGYLFLTQSVSDRTEQLYPVGFDPKNAETGKATDALRLSAFMGGAHLSYHLGEKVPFLLRLGAGAIVGQMRDERGGSFTTTMANGSAPYSVDAAVTRAMAAYFYGDLALRVGVRLGEHVDLSAGLQALVLVALAQPKWDANIEVYTGNRPSKAAPMPPTDGVARYHDDPLMGSVVFGLVPAASLRYEF
jgi:hypothetical protein